MLIFITHGAKNTEKVTKKTKTITDMFRGNDTGQVSMQSVLRKGLRSVKEVGLS